MRVSSSVVWQGVRLCAAALIAGVLALGQTGAGSLSGTVSDQSSAAVPGATVKLSQRPVGIERTVSTGGTGYYTFPALPRGEYLIEVEKAGFGVFSRVILLQVQENAILDVTLAVGDIATHVSVTAEAPVLQTNDAIVGQVINGRQTVELPLNGRQFSQLILLSPGAAPRGGGQQSGFTVQLGGGGISPAVNGQSGNLNNFTLDGLENNSRFANIWAVSPPPDAIQEFKVETGQRAGANVNIATRAGTNEFHGSVWEFLRNDKLDARNTFDAGKPPYRQNQYGLYAGGPLLLPKVIDGRKTNSWISGYWEGFRSRRGQTYFATVPTAEMVAGDLSRFLGAQTGSTRVGQIYDPFSTTADPRNPGSYLRQPYPGNIIPSNRLSSVAVDYLKYFYPAPNQPGFPNNLVSVQSRETNSDQWGVRFDQRVGRQNSLFVRANVFNGQSVSPSSVPLNRQYLENRTRSVGGSYTHVFSPTVIGTLGVAYTRDFTPNYTAGVPKELFERLGLSPFLPPYRYKGEMYIPQSVNLSGLVTSITQRGWFLGGPDYSYSVNGAVTKTAGSHSITGAVNILKWRHIGEPQPSFNTSFDQLPTALPSSVANTGSPFASFLLGLPTSTFNFNIPYKNINGVIWNLEARDTWKATRKLTLTLGLEWNLRSGPYFHKDEVSILDPGTGQWRWAAKNPITGEAPNLRRTVYDPERNMLAPRLGAAYQLSGTTVLRGGFSRFFDQNNWLIQKQQELLGNYPFGGRQQVVNANNDIPSGVTFTNPIPAGLTGVSELNAPGTSTQTHTRTPRVDQWNFGIQQLLGSDTALSADYVGTRGRHLMLLLRANVPATPGSGPLSSRVPFPRFGPFSINSDYGLSNYHSLQTKLEKRFSRGYTILASYTFSKALANTSGPQDSHSGTEIYNVRSTYGPANYDVTHAFVFSTVVDLPFGRGRRWLSSAGGVLQVVAGGWRLSGIVSAYSGFPLTPALSFDNANTGITPQRPDVVGDPVPSGFKQTRQAWFDTTAFATPARYTYGNAGWGILRAPGIRNLDLNVLKEFRVTESKRAELRFEFFNALNNTNLNGPSSTTVGNANFGRILSARDPRDIQVGLKFVW